MDYIPSARVTAAVRKWKDLPKLDRAIKRAVVDKSMFFHFKPGVKRYLPVALKPWVVTDAQRKYLRSMCITLECAAHRFLAARAERPELRELMPLTDGEEAWIRDAYGDALRRPETLFTRMDVSTHLGRPDWKERARFLEANFVGIGATYYCWCSGRIAGEFFAPRLEGELECSLTPETDILEMILRRCRAHGAKIGISDPTVAFVEYKRVEHGPFEYQTMQEIYRRRGYRVVVADPIELRLKGREIWYGDTKVDLLYRDPTLNELVDMEAEGDDVRAIRHAFRENRVVSTLAGEMDHKSIFELFSSRRWKDLFKPAERAMFRKHIPWTRLLRETRTDDPSGRDTDLVEYVRRHKESLILKPNRDYGGSGITIGNLVTAAEWDRAIERSLGVAVVQQRIEFNRDVYPVVSGGRVKYEERYIVTGVHAGEDECVILARMSEEPVVNITRGGAIVGVLVCRT